MTGNRQGGAPQQGGQPQQGARAQEAPRPPAEAGPKILEVVIRKAEGLPPPAKDTCITRLEGNMEKWVTGTRGGSLPFAVPKRAKILPVCICQIKNQPAARVSTGPATNGSITDPVFGRSPEYARGHLNAWKPNDTLVFMIKAGEQVIAMKEMPYSQYKNGYEWWFSLDVADMARYPEGYPYAAVQVKIGLIDGVTLSEADPWMTGIAEHKPDRGCAAKCCSPFVECYKNCCYPCCMWYSRRCYVCFRSCGANLSWLIKMCGLCCCLGCMECGNICGMTWSWCIGRNSLYDLRKTCAKRCQLEGSDEEEGDRDTACCCVPLRTAVFLMSALTFIKAAHSFFFPGAGASRYCGGYAQSSRFVLGATQLTGLFFGPVGVFGSLELSVSLLGMYNYYQFLRLFGQLFMLYTDLPLLADCGLWRTDINAAVKEYGWNPSMYTVAMGNSCLQAQIDFAIGCSIHLIVYIYGISLTRRLIWDTEKTPKYILAMPRDMPNGAFVSHSRTQGKSKPPYGAALGLIDTEVPQNTGKLGPAGMPHMNTGPTKSPLDRPYVPGHLPPDMMPQQPGGQAPRGTWHPNAMPPTPGMHPGMPMGMNPGMPMGPPGFQY